MLCWIAEDRNPQLEEMSTILKLLTNEFSALLNECSSLTDVGCLIKDLKRLCLSTLTKILNIDYFCLINILKCLLQWSN